MSKSDIKLQAGQKLKISHYRTVDLDTSVIKLTKSMPAPINPYKGKLFRKHEQSELPKEYTVGTKGGKTVVKLEDADGKVIAAGVALCSNEDVFSRKRGNQIAMGRVIAMIKEYESGLFFKDGVDILTEAHLRATSRVLSTQLRVELGIFN